ncbi:(p)ppGpp synthetase, partial [bacterium]|nr:(p)ppGpp synthetase [bacterium]
MFKIELFLKGIVNYFSDHPGLNEGALPVIHSVKSRLKDPKHLEDKIKRKRDKIGPINSDNILNKITDLAGIRVLHLYQAQFPEIHDE